MKRRLKINGLIISAGFFLIAVFPAVFLRRIHLEFYDTPAEIFGIAFILLGQILRVSARGYKSECSFSGNALIQTGPYALVRNPMYLGILLIGIGIVLMLFKWWVVCVFLGVFIIRYLLLIFKEEKKLLTTFSQKYRDYQNRVPCLLPSIEVIFRKDIAGYLPLKLSWVKKEIGSILTVLLMAIFLESWEDIRNEGIGVYLRESVATLIVIILFLCLVVYLTRRTNSLPRDVSS